MAIASKIKAAIDAGYSIDEIEQHLGNPGVVNKVATAFSAGYSPTDVDQYLAIKSDPEAINGPVVSSTAERMADDSAVIPSPSWGDVATGIIPAIVKQTPKAVSNWWDKAGENLSAMTAESSPDNSQSGINPLTGAIVDNSQVGQPVALSPAANTFLQETVKPAAMISAFIPGVNTIAAPVAGAFIVNDVVDAALREPGTIMVNGQPVEKSRIKNVLDVFGAEQIEQLFTNDPKLRESLLSDPLNTIGALLPVLLAGKTVANRTMGKTSKALEAKNIENKPIVEQVTEGMGTPEARMVITDPVTGVVRQRTQAEMWLPVEPYKPPTTPYITPAQSILPQESPQQPIPDGPVKPAAAATPATNVVESLSPRDGFMKIKDMFEKANEQSVLAKEKAGVANPWQEVVEYVTQYLDRTDLTAQQRQVAETSLQRAVVASKSVFAPPSIPIKQAESISYAELMRREAEKPIETNTPYLAGKGKEWNVVFDKDVSPQDRVSWATQERQRVQSLLDGERKRNIRAESNIGVKWETDARQYAKTAQVKEYLAQRKAIEEYISKNKTVEQALSDKVDAVIPPEKIQIGMTTKDVDIPIPQQQTVKPKFSDPVTEARYQAATKGLQPESIITKVKDFFADSYNKATRQFEHLPAGAEYAPLKFDLSTLEKAKAVSADRAGRILQGLTIEMKGDKGAYDLFQRKVLLDDLAQTEGNLPFGFTKESVLSDKTSIDGLVANSPKVAKAIADRTAVWNELKANYVKAMGDIGFDVSDRMSRQDYFRHQVLEYAKEKAASGNGSKLKTPTGSGFLRKRKGSEMDINANYLQAEFEVMAQMMHDVKTAETIKKVQNNYDIRPNLNEQAKAEGKSWREIIPEGYTTWQPREGSSFYMAQSIPEKLASQILDGTLKEVLTPDQLKQVMAKGSPFKEFVVKEEVAKTLDKISTAQNEGNVFKFFRGITTPWKIWTLSSPTRIIKYNIRNAVGDADAVATMNPRAFSKVKQASSELYQTIYGDRSMTPEMKAWFERGGMETTLNIQELPQINQLKMFKDFGSDNPNVIKKVWDGYWDKAQTANTYREAILRYANYLEYLDQMKANGGKPKTFGASRPDEVMALKALEDRAFKLSNETMGAYDSVSVLGKDLRATLLPFWSWSETNFTRYAQFLKNQAADGNIASTVAKKVGINAVKVPLAVGSFAVKASAVWAGLQAYNMSMFPEEEKELSPVEQAKPHIILGRDKDGNVRYFNRLGSVGDFLEWFGLDSPAKDVTDFMNGTRTPGEIIKDMAKRPVNKFAQAVTPYIKTPAELATGKQTFPDIFNARSLKDVPNYLANSVGLSNEFKAISRSPVGEKLGMMPRPGKPYLESTPENLLLYKTEPGRNAYYGILEEKRRFLESKGESGSGDFNSPRTEIMRNYKQALKLGDKETADKLLDKYYEYGGTSKGYKQSMQSMSPLAGMDKKKQYEFMSTLTKEQMKEFSKAMQYYGDVLAK